MRVLYGGIAVTYGGLLVTYGLDDIDNGGGYMPISSNIPLTRVPGSYTEIDNSQALSGVQTIPYKILLLAQKTAGGTATANVMERITNVETAITRLGAGSIGAMMAAASLAANQFTETWIMPISDNGAGVAATGSVAFSGTVTAAGTLELYIAGINVEVAITSGMATTAIATAVAAAITANANLPVSGVASTSTVNLTAKNKGEVGNYIDIRLNYYGETPVPGLTATITAMASGAGNPDITSALAAIGEEWFQIIASPYVDSSNLTKLETELATRFSPLVEIEGHAFVGATGSQSTLGTLGDSRNSPHLTIIQASYEPTPPWCKAAETAAITAYYAAIDPARPLQTLPYSYCLPPAKSARFDQNERNLLLNDGIATTYVDAGGVMRTERLVTTYKTNALGAPDVSYLDTETLLTLLLIRHDWKDYIRNKYPRHKLGDDGTRYGAGQAVVTPNVIKAEAFSKFREWELAGLVENFDQFKADLIVERNASDRNRMDVLLPPDIINQLRVVASVIAFRL
jgi:phage tail sheath gpL-like